MSTVFGSNYADAYDALYRDKNYESECDLLERIFRQYGGQPVRRVLDLGCGTGNHALRLAARGYEIVGVDRSADMLRLAGAKAKEQGAAVRFVQSPIGALALGEKFDAAVMMFAVLCYHIENDDVLAALRAARAHLNPGGLLAFDIWYGPSVLTDRPGERVRVIEDGNTKTLRATGARMDTRRQVCHVDFRLWRFAGETVTSQTSETHPMRYFFPKELELFLSIAGFELARLGAFPDLDRDADDTTWNAMAVARAV